MTARKGRTPSGIANVPSRISSPEGKLTLVFFISGALCNECRLSVLVADAGISSEHSISASPTGMH
jgi:hypothetical protein